MPKRPLPQLLLLSLALLIALLLLSNAAFAPSPHKVAAAPPEETTQATPLADISQIVFIPGTVEINAEIEMALRQAILNAGDVVPPVQYFAVTAISYLGSDQYISIAGLIDVGADLQWNLEDNLAWPGLALLRRAESGEWIAAIRGSFEFTQLFNSESGRMVNRQARLSLDPLQKAVATPVAYRFPWPDYTSMQYGMLGVHDAGFSTIVGEGWKAVDFFTDGNTANGHSPNVLLAMASGPIGYICKDPSSVAFQIGDLIYAHLIDNPNLQTLHYFQQGEAMGQLRFNDFSDRCGYASQTNKGHVHLGFPPGDSTFTAGGWTLAPLVNGGGIWRRGVEARYELYWLLAEPLTATQTITPTVTPTATPPPGPQVSLPSPLLLPAPGAVCTTAEITGTYWLTLPLGTDSTAYLTLNADQATSSNNGFWNPDLPESGFYKLEAFIPYHPSFSWPCNGRYIASDTSDAHYSVFHARGYTLVEANQKPVSNDWLNLGEFPFQAGKDGFVQLTDITHETRFTRSVSFSSMRFTWLHPFTTTIYLPATFHNTLPLTNPVTLTVRTQPAFDRCEAPSPAEMETWWKDSPYRIAALHLGGVNQQCANSELTSSWVAEVGKQGWGFIPTWSGMQAPCSALPNLMSTDLDTAYNQGRVEAEAAAGRAFSLGLVGKTGAILYYDLASYPGESDPICRSAVNAFVTGWSRRLHELKYKSGVRSADCSIQASDWLTITNPIDAIWLTSIYTDAYTSTATTSVPCLPDSLWDNHQRIRQYTGPHAEQWLTLTMTITSNIVDSLVVVQIPENGFQNSPSIWNSHSRQRASADQAWKRPEE